MNKCDIEEVKWQARQKFLELAKAPDLWKSDLYPAFAYWKASLLNWTIAVYICGASRVYKLDLADENIVRTTDPNENVSAAIIKIMEWHKEKRAQERCLELQEALQKSCQNIQRALVKETLLQRLLNFFPFTRSNSEKD